MQQNEYIVILEGVPTAKGPYSERQAREAAENAAPGTNPRIMRLARPVWWMPYEDDLTRFRDVLSMPAS